MGPTLGAGSHGWLTLRAPRVVRERLERRAAAGPAPGSALRLGGCGRTWVGLNPVGLNPVGLNPVGLNPVGLNPVGVKWVGPVRVGMNRVGLNRLRRRARRAVRKGKNPPPDRLPLGTVVR